MSHTICETAKIRPTNAQPKAIPYTRTLSSKIPFLPPSTVPLYPLPLPALGKLCRSLVVKASYTSMPDALGNTDAVSLFERCLRNSPAGDVVSRSSSSSSPVMYAPVMKKDYGAFGAVTLEKSKLNLT